MRSAQVESEAGGGFAQMDEKASMTFRLEAGFYAGQAPNCEKEYDRIASILKQDGHKNGHNGQF